MDNLGKTDLDIQNTQDSQNAQDSHGFDYEDMLPKEDEKEDNSEPSNWEQILSGFYDGDSENKPGGESNNPEPAGQSGLNSFDDFKELNIAPTETAYQLKPIKKKSIGPVVAIIAILVVGIAGLFVYLLMNDLLPFSSGDPAALYKKVETKYLNSLIKEGKDTVTDDAAYNYSLTFKPGAALNQLMELNPTTFSGKVNVKDGKYYYDLAVANGVNKYLEMQSWITESSFMFLFPTLSDIYVSYAINGEAASSKSFDSFAFAQKLSDKISKYYFDELGEITIEKSVIGYIGSAEHEYDVLNVQIPAEVLVKILQSFIDTMKEDPVFAEYNSMFNSINKSNLNTENSYLNMKLYLNKNDIMGRTFSVSEGELNMEFGYISGGKSGKSFTAWMNVTEKGQTTRISIDNDCTVNGNKSSGTLKGSININSFAKYTFSIDYTDLEFDKYNGITGGSMKINIPEIPITADVIISSSGKTATMSADIWYSGMSVLTLESVTEQITPESVTIPDANGRIVIIDENGGVTNGNYELAEQFSTEIQTGIMSILSSAPVDGKYDLVSFFLQSVTSMMRSTIPSIDYMPNYGGDDNLSGYIN